MIHSKLEAKDLIEDYKKKALRFPRATNSAINKVAEQTKTFISREIRAEYNIKSSDLNKNFKLKKSTWKNLQAKIEGIGRGISITKFGAKRSSKPKSFGDYKRYAVEAKVKKTGSKKTIPGTFKMKSTFGKRVGITRLPVTKVYGPGVANMFNTKMQNKASNHIQVIFPPILENEIKFFNE